MKLLVKPMLRPAILRPLRCSTACNAWALRCLAPLMSSLACCEESGAGGMGIRIGGSERDIVGGRGLEGFGLGAAGGISCLASLMADCCLLTGWT